MPEWFAVFDTPIGSGSISWNERGVSGVQLPEPNAARVRARLARHLPHGREAQPPHDIQRAIELINALLCGESVAAPLATGQGLSATVDAYSRTVAALSWSNPPNAAAA